MVSATVKEVLKKSFTTWQSGKVDPAKIDQRSTGQVEFPQTTSNETNHIELQ